MESETRNHRYPCLGDFLVEDKVADAIIDWHFTYGVYWLEDVGMMPDDGRYSCLGKSVGKSALTDAWIGLKLHTPMQDHYNLSFWVLMMEIADFIEKFFFAGLGNAWLIVDSTPVFYR